MSIIILNFNHNIYIIGAQRLALLGKDALPLFRFGFIFRALDRPQRPRGGDQGEVLQRTPCGGPGKAGDDLGREIGRASCRERV